MAGFDWAKPENVYVANVAVLWVLFVGVIAALLAADGAIAATASGPWPGSPLAEAAGRWPAMLVDYGFFWAVVVSVVPIPSLETQYRPAGTIVPEPSSEAPRRIAVKIGNGQAFVAVDEVLAVTAAENFAEPQLAKRLLLHRATMTQMQDILPPPVFLRVHRKSIVRVDAVTGVHRPRANAVELVLGVSWLSDARTVRP